MNSRLRWAIVSFGTLAFALMAFADGSDPMPLCPQVGCPGNPAKKVVETVTVNPDDPFDHIVSDQDGKVLWHELGLKPGPMPAAQQCIADGGPLPICPPKCGPNCSVHTPGCGNGGYEFPLPDLSLTR